MLFVVLFENDCFAEIIRDTYKEVIEWATQKFPNRKIIDIYIK